MLKPDARSLLRQKGLTVPEAERASGLSGGSLRRLFTGRRGKALPVETVRRLSRGTGIPFEPLAEALETTIADALERRWRRAEAERVRREAE